MIVFIAGWRTETIGVVAAIYGLLIGSFSVIAANIVTLVLALAILALKIVYDRRSLASSRK